MILDIPETYKNIAIMFSGGIDSALLLYLVGKQYPNRKIYAVTAGTVGYVDYPVHIDYARNVFDEIIKLLEPGAIDYHTIHYIDDRESHHCNKVMQDWKHIDLWIVGQNLSPPKGTIVSDCFNKSHDLWDLCPLPNRKNPQGEIWAEQHDKPVYRPLMFMNKKEIIEIYRNENVYHLIDYTRSCPKVWKLEEIQNFKKHCGYCWWCMEREWGLRHG
jgi:PP-loop superfamily ATP-utilizing enzyme